MQSVEKQMARVKVDPDESTVAPPAEDPETIMSHDGGELSVEDYPAYPDYYYGGEGTYPPDYYEEPQATTSQPPQQEASQQAITAVVEAAEAANRGYAQPEAEVSSNLQTGEFI